MEDIELKYHNHIEELNKINIVEYCLINRAMKKYRITNWIWVFTRMVILSQ